jgi:hypothetical protein
MLYEIIRHALSGELLETIVAVRAEEHTYIDHLDTLGRKEDKEGESLSRLPHPASGVPHGLGGLGQGGPRPDDGDVLITFIYFSDFFRLFPKT